MSYVSFCICHSVFYYHIIWHVSLPAAFVCYEMTHLKIGGQNASCSGRAFVMILRVVKVIDRDGDGELWRWSDLLF